jgi:hypothetical protein
MHKVKHGFTGEEINERFLALSCYFKMVKRIKGIDAKKEASKYMLMHQVDDTLYFKNIDTRKYISINMSAIIELIRVLNK